MQLINLLEAKLIYFEEKELSKAEIIADMTNRVCRHFKLEDCSKKLYELVMEQDRVSGIVYPTGITIPHVRKEGFDDTVICMCIPRKKLISEGQEIKIIVLIITDKASSKLYLNTVSALLKVTKDKKLFEAILNEKDGTGVMNLLKKADIRIKDELTIRDIMTSNPVVINQTSSLKELGDIILTHSFHHIPVVDERGYLVGEVNILQYLQVGIPEYMMRMDNLNFFRSSEPLERLYEKEESIKVKEIMTYPPETLSPETSIIEAVCEMLKNNRRYYIIEDGKKPIGVLTAMDIVKRLVRA